MKSIRYYIDPATDRPHIENHSVTTKEVEEVLRGKHLTVAGRSSGPGRPASRIALGQTVPGRYLKVVYAQDKDGSGVFVITAYDLRGKELLAYRRRIRRGLR